MRARAAQLAFFVSLFLPQVALPFDAEGHSIVAAIAELRMGERSRLMVKELLPLERISDREVASWADQIRDRKTGRFHYVNIPFENGRYSPARDCPQGECAVERIRFYSKALERTESRSKGHEALLWLVHLVADLHQPLHAGDGWDRGGNDKPVRLSKRREPTNLHRVFDHDVVKKLAGREEPDAVARKLLDGAQPAEAARWAEDLDPKSWAESSSARARAIYAELRTTPREHRILALPKGYLDKEIPLLRVALLEAGVRLAALLDSIAEVRQKAGRRFHVCYLPVKYQLTTKVAARNPARSARSPAARAWR